MSTESKLPNDETASNSAESKAAEPTKEIASKKAETQEDNATPQQPKAASASTASQKNSLMLTVSSAHGDPDPENGVTKKDKDTQVTCSVKSPAREGFKFYKCTGWIGTGSVPQTGQAASVTFPITDDSKIEWQWQPTTFSKEFIENSVWQNQVASLILLVIIFWLGLEFYFPLPHAFFLAVFAGALGGMIHEFAQSYGKFLLPNTDAKGNQCLGMFVGIASGGVAGLLIYKGLIPHASVGPELAVSAIISGLAAKGLVDAPNPPTPKKS